MQALEEGQRFERYRIQGGLSKSVSGISYEAEDTFLQRKVTLKLIHPWTTLPDAARRQFFREMQGISALTHPYLAAILDYGEVDGQLYIARRYVTPGSLLGSEGRYWFHPPLDILDAVHYTRQLAQVLQYIHNSSYIHGALTFANVLILRGAGADKDADFAPFLLADVGTTHFVRRFGQLKNTLLPITAAPEQFGKRVTSASDQYALAVILYFWLTGRPPFLGTPEEIEQLKLTETLTTLTALNIKVPLELEGVIRRALSVYPEERYPSVMAFANALQTSIVHLMAVEAPPVAQTEMSIETVAEPTEQSSISTEVVPETMQVEEVAGVSGARDESTAEKTEQSSEEVHRQNGHISDHKATDKHTWVSEAEQFFRDGLTSILEVISMKPVKSEPQSEQPVQPSQPEIPQQPMQPEPLPQLVPDIPQPLPEPTPIPEPSPETPQQPAPEPKPDPDIVPPPAPDIPQPIPEPKPIPPVEPAQNNTLHEDSGLNEAKESPELPLQASLIITSTFIEKPQEIILDREETTLGRAGSSDILLDQDTLTSRHHALLKHEGDSYFIYDRSSANGSSVNGQKIAPGTGYELKDGDSITIGEYELVFRFKSIDQPTESMLHQSL